MSKYEPLREHLARLEDVVWAAKLDEVENILGTNLPKSAREHRTWWANSGGSLVHQNAWLDAGWRVERTDLMRDVIVFRRLRIGGTVAVAKSSNGEKTLKTPKRAAEKRLVKEMAALRQPATVTLRSEWTTLGSLQETPCSNGSIPKQGGVVRFAAMDGDDVITTIVASPSIQKAYRALRLKMNGHDSEDGYQTGVEIVEKSGFDLSAPIECDTVKGGNAWLLTDGRGRKADLDDPKECHLVAQLLYLQELQAGRKSVLILK